MNCPICNTTINDVKENLFCPVCHWELAAIPPNALLLKKDYDNRYKTYQSGYDSCETVETLSNKIKIIRKENDTAENELAKLKKNIKEKIKIFGQLEIEYLALLNAQRENCKKQKKLKDIELEIEKEQNELKDLLALEEKVKELEKAYRYAFHRGFGSELSEIKKFLEDYKNVNIER